MFFINAILCKIMNYISSHVKTKEDFDKAYYGVQIIIINISKLIILFTVAMLFNTIKNSFLILIFFSLIRMYAFGIHLDSSLHCNIFNLIVFVGGGFLVSHVVLTNKLILVISLISLIIMLIYAPADTQKRPIIKKKLRKLLKIKSFLMVLILSCVSLYLNNHILKNIIIYSIIVQCICILPIVYKLLGKEYRNYEKYSNN